MRNRAEPILKIVCLALAALLVTQTVRAILRSNPLAKTMIPAVPALSTNNTPSAKSKNSPPGTNSSARANTQLPRRAATDLGTNNGSNRELKNENTNAVANSVAAPNPATSVNLPALATNNAVATTDLPGTDAIGSNSVAFQTVRTNSTATSYSTKTNATMVLSSLHSPGPGSRSMLAMMGMPGMGGGKPLPELPIATKARIDRISESELLGPVMRPMPMALLGIAGNSAFLRSATGQSGLVKEGDSLGELKLIRIGINRVLVDENGQKKELLIFNGYGGESLMPKQNETDETTAK